MAMEEDTSVLHRLSDRLPFEPDRLAVLSEMLAAVRRLEKHALEENLRNLQISTIFECLNSSKMDEVMITGDILRSLLSSMDSSEVLAQYGQLLQEAIAHPTAEVKLLAIRELLRAAHTDSLVPVLRDDGFLITTVPCVFSDNSAVTEAAKRFFVKVCDTKSGLDAFFSEPLMRCLNQFMSHSDAYRLSGYEFVADIAASLDSALTRSVECGFLGQMLEELKGDDVLFQFNILSVLSKIASTEHGFYYLKNANLLAHAEDKLCTSHPAALDTFVLPGYVRFFGSVFYARPAEAHEACPSVLPKLFGIVAAPDSDLSLQSVSMETIGHIAEPVAGKRVLDGLGTAMPELMARLKHFARTLPLEYKVCALNAMACAVDLQRSDQSEETLALTSRWFSAEESGSPLDVVVALCRQPFPALKMACLQLLSVLAGQPWGLQLIRDYPGLVDFLLDRSGEPSKLCKEAKYNVVQTIVAAHSAHEIFGFEALDKMNTFIQQGPFYVDLQAEVAFEEDE
ncbi:26S proteasome non-ATPase regulatory subunit 5-like [Schistocerca cancellata]|uniref:26S proteasome non-ATPase regulatory subunit 5-like n=1 Tax=Schistocerca cancellata TaxID=274614 RepID=UPI00211978DA|nr:26S proteasome non-ATPase regulatory subunit 5-like [Schistocerca cancellata]